MSPEMRLVVIVLAVCLLLIVGIASSRWFGDDNPIEQQIEHILEEETGIEIDLSPEDKDDDEIKET